MKRFFYIFFSLFLLGAFINAEYVGKVYFKPENAEESVKILKIQDNNLITLINSEINKGNLRLKKIQKDPVASMEHHRYSQFFKGLEVFGGQIIQHYRNGKLIGINGEYYQDIDVSTEPVITQEEAVEFFRVDLNKEDLKELGEMSKLLIYPIADGDYHLAYKIILEKGIGYSMTGIIDALNGEVRSKYSNIMTEDFTIGLGTGLHGGNYKLPTTYYEGIYWLKDERRVRPVNQYTSGSGIFDVYGNYHGYLASDMDNYWDYDRAVVNVHAFVGWTYDYYFQVHGRNGIDDNNMNIIANVNVYIPQRLDNAAWGDNRMWFFSPGLKNQQFAAAIDFIAHEYSHGVTEYEIPNWEYKNQSGALNESFSDIMGTAVEHYWQQRGSGFNKADWVIGEDSYQTYYYSNYARSLSDPNSKGHFWGSYYPCHLSQYYDLPFELDYGGVHINCTIYPHAYYLLAEGGTNKVSGKSVIGIGIDRATQIFYRAWVNYLTSGSIFINAANALLYSVIDLYGSGSNEYTQTIRAMEAIGYIFVGGSK